MNNKIELLAPAGDLEKLKTAIIYGADAVYAYKDNVEMVGYKAGQRQLPYSKDDFETYDWSHRSVVAHTGDVIVFMNKDGRFLAVKVVKVNDRERGSATDLLHVEFRIY